MKEKEIKKELQFLKERLQFRHKLFVEWAFIDDTLIDDIKKFGERTREIENEIIKTKEDVKKVFREKEEDIKSLKDFEHNLFAQDQLKELKEEELKNEK